MINSQKQIVIKVNALNQAQRSILSQSDKLENLHLITFYL